MCVAAVGGGGAINGIADKIYIENYGGLMELNINKICWQRSVADTHTPAAGGLRASTGYLVTSALSARRLTAPRSGSLPPASISTSQLTQLMDLKVTQELFPRPFDGILSRCCPAPARPLVMQAGSCTLLRLPCTRHQALCSPLHHPVSPASCVCCGLLLCKQMM